MLEASCLSGLRATAVLFLLSASALAHEIDEIDCDNELCGQVSNAPRTVLISVNPDRNLSHLSRIPLVELYCTEAA